MENPPEQIVYIVDDNKDLTAVLRRLIESTDKRCEVFHSSEQFLQGFDPERAGCIVLDIRMPGMSGLELQEYLRNNGVNIPELILTGHADVPVAVRAMEAGAFKFLEKPVSNQILLEQVRLALNHNAKTKTRQAHIDQLRARAEQLTRRERQVMGLVVAGNANKTIGANLGLSQKTVEVHRSHVMQKMKARSVAELVKMAIALEDNENTA